MKVKSESIRKSILEAAKIEFYNKGYKEANIREIASAAGITPGNIYRYYGSKAELFEAIVGHVNLRITEITQLKKSVFADKLKSSGGFIKIILGVVFDWLIKYRYEVAIIFNRSEGSPYEGVKQKFISFAGESILSTMKNKDRDLAMLYSYTTISSVLVVLTTRFDKPKEMKDLLMKFLTQIFKSSCFVDAEEKK